MEAPEGAPDAAQYLNVFLCLRMERDPSVCTCPAMRVCVFPRICVWG